MKHLGDITKIDGHRVPITDVVVGGSPCQDLSVAGKRAGLAGERSGLYMEQIRVIKEMREQDALSGRADELIRPRYMVWENVPGAFSSNGGKDFAAVLEEAIRVAEPEAPPVSVPEKGWPTAGCFYDMGGRWSVAWRVHDSQFWGVPQRRKRLALVSDFGGLTAPEICFELKGLHRDSAQGGEKRKATAGDSGNGSVGTGKTVGFPLGFRPENVRCYDETATTLCNGTRPGFTTGVIQPLCIEMTSTKNTIIANGISPTLTARMGTGGNQVNAVVCPNGVRHIVRRLTPLECERLQGFPDGWTDIGDWVDSKGKKHKAADSPRYKALGNSIALPYWKVLLKRISAQYERDATMASLFDGIGGFPYIWEQLNGKGSCLWASENEEFPMAVTRMRFGDE